MSTIREYHLRIVPPEPIYSDVVNFKNQFMEIFGKHKYSKAKPHITLALFKMDARYEDLIVKCFQQLTNIKRFQMQINGFNIFDTRTYVLFLDIPSTDSFFQIQQRIEDLWTKHFQETTSKLITSKKPHMTISAMKEKESLLESFDVFKKHKYFKSFEVDQIILTSRPLSQTWDWEYQIPLTS